MSKTLTLLTVLVSTPLTTCSNINNNNNNKYYFIETFDNNNDIFESGKWIKSNKDKYIEQPILIKPSINSPPELKNDKGLELTKEMRFYGVSSKFNSPLIINNQDLIVQYEFKADSFQCGGAYIKLPRASDSLDFNQLDNDTPYTIMFGPDRCGATNKVHFILQHQNPITKKWEEKHFAEAPAAKTDTNTHLYTLHLRKDNSFAIYIDKQLEKEGNLLTSMEPSVNPPKEIDDPSDKKPADWVDEAKIIDPDATKPDDWDESQPAQIIDENAVKPAGWLDDVEPLIDDPEAEKPADWDDEEDGEWESPQIPNPLCTVGCGKWNPPRIRNPLYKGKWTAPYIDNPLYKGEWKPRQIPNPNYFEDLRPADIAPIGGIALEVWTTNSGFHFDNFVITNYLDDAFSFADETFSLKVKYEQEMAKQEELEQRKQAREQQLAEGGFVNVLQVYVAEAFEFIGAQPPIAIVLAVILIFTSIFFFIPSSSSSSSKKKETTEAESATENENENSNSNETTSNTSKTSLTTNKNDDNKSKKEKVSEQEQEQEEEEEEEVSPSKSKRRTRKTD